MVKHPNPHGKAGRADRHYDLMTLDEIKALTLPPTAKDGWLFLWCPARKVHTDGIPTLRAWGYRTTGSELVWMKTQKHDPVTRLFAYLAKHPEKKPPAKLEAELLEIAGKVTPVCGMGYYARIAHEVLIIGKKGKPGPPKERNIRSVVPYPRGRHSEKPELFAELITRFSDGPYTELFARKERAGWTCLGNELGDKL